MASRTSQSSPRSSIDTSRSSVDKERPASTEPVVTRQSIEVSDIKPTEPANQVDKPTSSDSPASRSSAEQPATSEGSDSREISEQNFKHDFPTPIIVEPPSEAEPRSAPEQVTDKSGIQQESNSPIPDTRHPVEAPQIVDAPVEESQKDQDAAQAHAPRSEEIQEYIEQIDSLQAKLQFLSKNAANAARQTAGSAEAGSVERKLAEKDEKIALLMEEGRKLSTSEQKFRTTVRKLRTQIIDNEKQANELKKGKEKALAEVESLRSRINNKEEQEKRHEEVRKASATLQKEIDALKKDKAVKEEAYRRLEQESKAMAEQIQAAHAEVLKKALDVEKNKQQELDRTIASLQSEKEALVEKLRLTEVEWQEKLDRALERGRNIEEELKLELRATEGKLEAMRVTAEEASAGSGGDIKLIRHIETLQSQYASASENWQGIETSLLTKAASLEKERDEAQRRESEMRKKARDAVNHIFSTVQRGKMADTFNRQLVISDSRMSFRTLVQLSQSLGRSSRHVAKSLLPSESNTRAWRRPLNRHATSSRSNSERRAGRFWPRPNEGNGQTMLLQAHPGPRADPIPHCSLLPGPLVRTSSGFLYQQDSLVECPHREAKPKAPAMASSLDEECPVNLLALVLCPRPVMRYLLHPLSRPLSHLLSHHAPYHRHQIAMMV